MRNMKRFIAGIICAASLAAEPALCAGEGIVLVGGTRALIEGRRLILIGENSERVVAPVGTYLIRESSQAIHVTYEGVEVRARPPEIQ